MPPFFARASHSVCVVALVSALGASAGNSAFANERRGTGPDEVTRSRPAIAANVCCNHPSLPNYGHRLDFDANYDGEEITTQFRPQGMLFGKGATVNAPRAMVTADYTRLEACQLVLTGHPAFSGWEFFIFVDPLEDKWARVQNIGVHLGYSDFVHSGFIAVYDANGNLLESKFNDEIGFDFVSINRPTADICMVLVGDCTSAGGVCYPDPGGSAFTCLTYSTPVSTPVSLPPTITMPAPPPPIPGTPGAPAWVISWLALGLVAVSLWTLRKRSAQEA